MFPDYLSQNTESSEIFFFKVSEFGAHKPSNFIFQTVIPVVPPAPLWHIECLGWLTDVRNLFCWISHFQVITFVLLTNAAGAQERQLYLWNVKSISSFWMITTRATDPLEMFPNEAMALLSSPRCYSCQGDSCVSALPSNASSSWQAAGFPVSGHGNNSLLVFILHWVGL